LSLEVGEIVKGKVTHIADFGAFVALEGGNEGLVHISEVAQDYVKDINQYVAIGDELEVKIIGVNKQGKMELSIKQTQEQKPAQSGLFLHRKSADDLFEDKLTSYLKRSEERQIDIRRNLKKKQGIAKRRR